MLFEEIRGAGAHRQSNDECARSVISSCYSRPSVFTLEDASPQQNSKEDISKVNEQAFKRKSVFLPAALNGLSVTKPASESICELEE